MSFLKRLLPKGSGPKGFKAAASDNSDTSYLDRLIQHTSAGVVEAFVVARKTGNNITIPTTVGFFGRKVSNEELKDRIHQAIKLSDECRLVKSVKVRDDGKTPLSHVGLAVFQNGEMINPSRAPGNHGIPSQGHQEHPAPAADQ